MNQENTDIPEDAELPKEDDGLDETEQILSDLLNGEDDQLVPDDNFTSMLEGVQGATAGGGDKVFSGMDSSDTKALFKSNISDELKDELDRVLQIKVPFQVVLAEKKQSIYETINLQVGSLIEFDKYSDEQLDVFVNNQNLGTGEVVKVSEKFGVRIKSIVSIKEKIRRLGV